MKDLKREEEANYEQSSRRDFGGHQMHDMVTFLLMLNLMSIIFIIAMRVIELELKMIIMIHFVKEFQEMMLELEEIM